MAKNKKEWEGLPWFWLYLFSSVCLVLAVLGSNHNPSFREGRHATLSKVRLNPNVGWEYRVSKRLNPFCQFSHHLGKMSTWRYHFFFWIKVNLQSGRGSTAYKFRMRSVLSALLHLERPKEKSTQGRTKCI